MRVRILSEWNGSGRCGSVVEIDDVVATGRISGGFAEAVAPLPPPVVVETHVAEAVVETSIDARKPRKGRA